MEHESLTEFVLSAPAERAETVLSRRTSVPAEFFDGIDDEAARFYKHDGFIRSPAEPSMRTVRKNSDIQADVETQ